MKTYTSKKIKVSELPSWLKTALKILGVTKRECSLVVLHGPLAGHPEACDVRWGGGTKNDYDMVEIGTADRICQAHFLDGDPVTPISTHVTVEHGFFCGKPAGVRIYIREDQLARFCGGQCSLCNAPAGAVADWLEENGQEEVSQLVRKYFY